jgi:hypothetical protein
VRSWEVLLYFLLHDELLQKEYSKDEQLRVLADCWILGYKFGIPRSKTPS